jgi:hypothetical protein
MFGTKGRSIFLRLCVENEVEYEADIRKRFMMIQAGRYEMLDIEDGGLRMHRSSGSF